MGRFWVVLGAVLGGSWGHFSALARAGATFSKITLLTQIRRQEATWADLGSIWEAKKLQNGGRGGSKSELRSVDLRCVKLSEVEVSLSVEKGG